MRNFPIICGSRRNEFVVGGLCSWRQTGARDRRSTDTSRLREILRGPYFWGIRLWPCVVEHTDGRVVFMDSIRANTRATSTSTLAGTA